MGDLSPPSTLQSLQVPEPNSVLRKPGETATWIFIKSPGASQLSFVEPPGPTLTPSPDVRKCSPVTIYVYSIYI